MGARGRRNFELLQSKGTGKVNWLAHQHNIKNNNQAGYMESDALKFCSILLVVCPKSGIRVPGQSEHEYCYGLDLQTRAAKCLSSCTRLGSCTGNLKSSPLPTESRTWRDL